MLLQCQVLTPHMRPPLSLLAQVPGLYIRLWEHYRKLPNETEVPEFELNLPIAILVCWKQAQSWRLGVVPSLPASLTSSTPCPLYP